MILNSKNNDFSLIIHLFNIPLFSLLSGILIFDSLLIIVFKLGIIDADFLNFFDLSKIPFLLLFLAAFCVINTLLSSLIIHLIRYLFNKIVNILSEKLQLKSNNDKNQVSANFLYSIALATENSFLIKYINNEKKVKHRIQKSFCVLYSLTIAILINIIITRNYNANSITLFIFSLCTNTDSIVIMLLSIIMITPIVIIIFYGLICSVIDDIQNIYFPYEKFIKLHNEYKSLLNN